MCGFDSTRKIPHKPFERKHLCGFNCVVLIPHDKFHTTHLNKKACVVFIGMQKIHTIKASTSIKDLRLGLQLSQVEMSGLLGISCSQHPKARGRNRTPCLGSYFNSSQGAFFTHPRNHFPKSPNFPLPDVVKKGVPISTFY